MLLFTYIISVSKNKSNLARPRLEAEAKRTIFRRCPSGYGEQASFLCFALRSLGEVWGGKFFIKFPPK